MKLSNIIQAALKPKNLILLAAIITVSYMTAYIPFMLIGAAGYIYFVRQTLKDGRFLKECRDQDTLDGIQGLHSECRKLYGRVIRILGRDARKRVSALLQEEGELMRLFLQDSEDPLKGEIAEKALTLVAAYMKLVYDYEVRCREARAYDMAKLAELIARKERKLAFLANPDATADMEKSIELDKNLLQRLQNDKNELEALSARLDYIESTIMSLKHQIMSSADGNILLEDIDNAVNEASALDATLSRREGKKSSL